MRAFNHFLYYEFRSLPGPITRGLRYTTPDLYRRASQAFPLAGRNMLWPRRLSFFFVSRRQPRLCAERGIIWACIDPLVLAEFFLQPEVSVRHGAVFSVSNFWPILRFCCAFVPLLLLISRSEVPGIFGLHTVPLSIAGWNPICTSPFPLHGCESHTCCSLEILAPEIRRPFSISWLFFRIAKFPRTSLRHGPPPAGAFFSFPPISIFR